jgi:hypothetical protein
MSKKNVKFEYFKDEKKDIFFRLSPKNELVGVDLSGVTVDYSIFKLTIEDRKSFKRKNLAIIKAQFDNKLDEAQILILS